VLLDLIDREMKTEFNVVLSSREITSGFTVKTLSTQAGELPLIPEWALSYTGTPGSGTASLPAFIVTEDLIEYHWLSESSPRIFQLGLPNSLASQYVVVKFGGLVVKGANYAHAQVTVQRNRQARRQRNPQRIAIPRRILDSDQPLLPGDLYLQQSPRAQQPLGVNRYIRRCQPPQQFGTVQIAQPQQQVVDAVRTTRFLVLGQSLQLLFHFSNRICIQQFA
jgi:hypothetical protein